jgi:hypothetical protein
MINNSRYVDEAGLTEILSQKIDQGFTFPLNPKWVLSDANRWYELYQKLLMSDKEETRQSMNIWFPPESGVREQIERVHALRPEGFYEEHAIVLVEEEEASAHGSSCGRNSSRDKGKKAVSAKEHGHQDHLLSIFSLNLMEDGNENSRTISDNEMGDSSRSGFHHGSKKVKKAVGKVKKRIFRQFLSRDSLSMSGETGSHDGVESIVSNRKAAAESPPKRTSSKRVGTRRASMAGNVTSATINDNNKASKKRLAFDLELELKEKATNFSQTRASAQPDAAGRRRRRRNSVV